MCIRDRYLSLVSMRALPICSKRTNCPSSTGFGSACTGAVSYTHLDVYKRQEVDTGNERLALRSIDIFMDGHTHNIPDLYDGAIEITPIPTVEELNAHIWGEEFHACVIEKAEFEAIWESHTYNGALKESGGF